MSEPYDVFLSHATPDKDWVLSLQSKLEALGLRVFVDSAVIEAGDNFVNRISDALADSRYLVLVLSQHTEDRPWVTQEWTSWMASQGPRGRLLPVRLDAVDLPPILASIQATEAIDRDAQAVADTLFAVIGDVTALPSEDARRLVLGRSFSFTLSRDAEEGEQGEDLALITPAGERRSVPLPWQQDSAFGIAHLGFTKLQQTAVDDTTRGELFRHARHLGQALFDLLFDATTLAQLKDAMRPGFARPVIEVRSDDPLLLSLPWELLTLDDVFVVGDRRVDLTRTTLADAAPLSLLKAPSNPFKLAVNVSAPEGGTALNYEAESYRITLATAGHCEMVPTELGTLADLVDTVAREQPTGILFSGHGAPGQLVFEDDRGFEDKVAIEQLLAALRDDLPDASPLPAFFYLASCHGNEPARLEDNAAGSASAATQLHDAGVTEVVGYFGPILDELSTRAEEALYAGIAAGLTTRDAVRRARAALRQPIAGDGPLHPHRDVTEQNAATNALIDTHPFAWAQLVYYRRGPEWPLSVPDPAARRTSARNLKRVFQGVGSRRVLGTGFIGRRAELHKIRRRRDDGRKVLVLQGLGGLGKSTLAQRVLPMLTTNSDDICTLWCQDAEATPDRAEALVGQLLEYCRNRFGLDWEGVVQQVDQMAGDNSARRFALYLQVLVQQIPDLVLYLDNLESLLIGPPDTDEATAFAAWADEALAALWQHADQMARDSAGFYLVASCRYRHPDFGDALLPVPPLSADALFRLTAWFPALQRLSLPTRARLVGRLDGHPRAVEYANDLVSDALQRWQDREGEWSLPEVPSADDIAREWDALVEPALPQVAEQLKDNLLLAEIWRRVLDDRARDFLYRMTVLRRPAAWSLLRLLGEPGEADAMAEETAERLRTTSLLEQAELLVPGDNQLKSLTRYRLHPATAEFVLQTHDAQPEMLLQVHARLGDFLEQTAAESSELDDHIEAGYHLFEAGEYDRAYAILGPASDWLQKRGRVREGLALLTPFLDDAVGRQMAPSGRGRMLGTVGLAHDSLSEVEKAIGHFEQALVISRDIGDRYGEGIGLGNLGRAYVRLSEVEKAIGYFEHRVVIAREVDDRRGEGTGLGNLGSAYLRLSEVEKAIDYHEQQLVITREIGDRHGEGNGLGNLGLAYAGLGEVEKAIDYYEQQLVITREIGDRQGEGSVLGNLGIANADLGEVERAIGFYEQQRVIARETGDRQGEGNGLGSLGSAYARLGEVEKAIDYHEQALVILREIGDRRGEGTVLGNLGLTYLHLDEVEKAIGYHELALVISREIGDRRGEGSDLGNLGNAYAALGEVEKARGLLQQALEIGQQIGDPQIVQIATRQLREL